MKFKILTVVLAFILPPWALTAYAQFRSGSGVYGSGGGVAITTVGGLAGLSPVKGQLAVVTDGATTTDCGTGAGTDVVVCQYGGSTWVATSPAGSGANTALGNLSSVAVNTSLLPASDNTIDLDSVSHRYANAWFGATVYAQSFQTTGTGAYTVTGTESSCTGAASGQDVLCLGDSTLHRAEISNNNGAFSPVALISDITTVNGVACQPGQSCSTAIVPMTGLRSTSLAASTTTFIAPCGSYSSTTETQAACVVPVSGTITALHVSMETNPPYTIAFHGRYDGANFTSDLTCTINTTGNTYCDAVGGTQAVTEGVGNTIDVSAVTGTGTAATHYYSVSLKITGAH